MPSLPIQLKKHYSTIFAAVHSLRKLTGKIKRPELLYTPGDRLIGDLGEALAIYLFELHAMDRPNAKGHDFVYKAIGKKSKKVQVKATTELKKGNTIGLGNTASNFEHLIVFKIYEDSTYEILFNGPYGKARDGKDNTRTSIVENTLRKINDEIKDSQRLPFKAKKSFKLAE